MTAPTQHGQWFEFESVRSSLGDLTVEIVPALGAKIASIIWRGQEWLLQPRLTVDWSRPRVDYERAELCGWDEMFPTIVGAGLPDHGEVWSREWVPSPTSSLTFSVTCQSVPASFRRAVRLASDDELQLDYSVKNLSDAPLSFLWAAHPQFVASDHDVVTIQGAALAAVTESARRTLPSGGVCVADIAGPGQTGKWWNPQGDLVSGVSLQRGGSRLLMSLAAPHPPQWGVWIDRGAIAHADVVSLQPALGWHDDLHRAIATETAVTVAAHATVQWSLSVQFLAEPA